MEVALQIRSEVDYGTNGLVLLGLVDTPGDALSVCLRDGYAYVGGTTNSVVDIRDPRNPRIVRHFDAGLTALTANHLLGQNGLNLQLFSLTNPAQPTLFSSVAGGVSGTHPNQLETFGPFAFIPTLVFGWDNYGNPLFIRGDMIMFDISNPASPRSLGLLYNTYHSSYPQYPGSDYFMGYKNDIKDGIVLLPSSTSPSIATGGTGRLRIINAQGTNRPAVLGSFDLPGTTLLTAIAAQGDRALVTGNRSPFVFRSQFVLSGNPTITLLGITNPAAPTILSPTFEITNINDRPYGQDKAFAGTNGFYFVANLTRNSKPVLVVVDARDVTNLTTRVIEVPAAVAWAITDRNLLYTASSAGLGIYDLGGVVGVPVVAQVRVPNAGGASVVPGSFNVAPDETIAGTNDDTLVWRFDLSSSVTNRLVTRRSSVTNLAAGETRPVTLGATIGFTAWGSDSNLELPPLTVAGEHLLALTPAAQTARPGETVTFTVVLTNAGPSAVACDLAAQGMQPSWLTLAPTVTVPAQSQAQVPLVLRADTAAAAGEHGFTVSARNAQGLQDAARGVLTLTDFPLVNDRVHGVVAALSPPQAIAGPGTPAQFVVRLVNTGNATDCDALSAQVPPGFVAQFGRSEVEVVPGMANYREVLLSVTPPLNAAPGTSPSFTALAVSTNDPAAQHQVTGTVNVIGVGVAVGFTPASGPPGSTFTLNVTNTGSSAQTFDLRLGGSAAPSASWATGAVTLASGAWQSVTVNIAALDYGYPGSPSLLATATAHDQTNISALASASVVVTTNHGLTASFEPALVGVPTPEKAYALLVIRNTGNTEDVFSARITSVAGPLTANLRGASNQLVQQISPVRLPGLASGGLLLEADVTGFGTGAVRVVINSLDNTNLSTEATVNFRSGVWLRFAREWIIELTYDPVPGVDHFVQYRDGFGAGAAAWADLPGGPHNRGWYYLCVPANCAAFAPTDYADTNRLFLDVGDRPQRDYRLRVMGGAVPRPRMRLSGMSALRFDPLPGYDHTLQSADQLGAAAQWVDLPRGPHNLGLGFDPQPANQQRFYRVMIRKK